MSKLKQLKMPTRLVQNTGPYFNVKGPYKLGKLELRLSKHTKSKKPKALRGRV